MRTLTRVLLVSLAVALLLVGALFSGAYWLFGTEGGTAWLVERVLPEELSVDRMEGRLLGPLTLYGIEHRTEGAETRIDRLHLEWLPRALLDREVAVTLVEVDGVTFVQYEGDPEATEEPLELPDLQLPLRIEVVRARLSDLRLRPAGGEEQDLADEIVVTGLVWDDVLLVEELRVEAEGYRAHMVGTVEPRGGYPLDLEVAWEVTLPDQPRIAGGGRLGGSVEELRIQQSLSAPIAAEVSARVVDALSDPRWELDVYVPRFALREIQDDLNGHELGLELVASGDLESADVRADLTGMVEEVGEMMGLVDLTYGDDEVLLTTLALHFPSTGSEIIAEGVAEVAADPLAFELSGRWTDLGWPVTGEPELRSADGRFHLVGNVEEYDLEVEGGLSGDGVPEGRWTLAGRGTDTAMDLRLGGEVLNGRLEAQGSVAWNPQLAWDLRVEGEGLDPSALDPDFPGGALAVAFESSGRLDAGNVFADVFLETLEGELEGIPVEGAAELSVAGERIEIESLFARTGSTELGVRGSVETAWDLEWELDAPDLAELSGFMEGIGGTLAASGELTGDRERPHVTAFLSGDSLALDEFRVRRMESSIDVDLSDARPSSFHLTAEALEAPTVDVPELRLEGDGTLGGHTLTLHARGIEDRTVEVILQGRVEDERWDGALERATLALPIGDGDWTLRDSAPLSIGADRVELSIACWEGVGRESLCLEGDWSEDMGGMGRLNARDFPLELVSPWIPGVAVEGELDLEAEGQIDSDGTVLARGTLVGSPGLLRYEPEPEEFVERSYEGFEVNVEGDEEALVAGLSLRFSEARGLEGEIRAARAEAIEDWGLSGHLSGVFDDDGLTGALMPDLAPTGGTLRLDLRPEGSVGDPLVRGSLSVTDGMVGFPLAGVQLQEIGIELSSEDGAVWSLTGSARSGSGTIELDGDLALPVGEADWSGEIAVRGEDFEALNTPLARVLASPELETHLSPDRIEIRGRTLLPEAQITLQDLEGTVVSSPDVVVVRGEDELAEEPAVLAALFAEVTVEMGEEVHLDAFGLSGRLAGALTVDAAPGRPIRGRGELQIVDGEYTMYRQTLEIERGRLVFADGPIDDPGLDIRVIRETRDVRAGMDISGTATEPRATVFSEPAMAEADVLSYLVLGRPATFAGEEDGEVLGRAASAVGMAGAQRIADRVGRGILGLDEARVETEEGEGLQEAQLVVGTYISPRLYVGYGLGLFETTNVLRVRYHLGEDWLLRTESGVETGADLLYSRER